MHSLQSWFLQCCHNAMNSVHWHNVIMHAKISEWQFNLIIIIICCYCPIIIIFLGLIIGNRTACFLHSNSGAANFIWWAHAQYLFCRQLFCFSYGSPKLVCNPLYDDPSSDYTDSDQSLQKTDDQCRDIHRIWYHCDPPEPWHWWYHSSID